jgi:hypothetical protein
MKRIAPAFLVLLSLVIAGTAVAGPPLDGVYDSTDLGGSVLLGRYSEAWDAGGSAVDIGTTLNAESWDGTNLATQWRYWCATIATTPIILTDNVDANGNGTRTYQKTFVGGFIWLSGSGPWANGDPDYPGVIDTYDEFETVTYQNFVPVGAVTNVQASAHFDNYPEQCMTFYIANGSEVGSTDLGDTKPADYPDFLATDCSPTRVYGAWWDLLTLTLTISGCNVPVEETTWGGIKVLYSE